MNHNIETDSFISGLDKVARVRQEIYACLDRMADTLKQAELAGQRTSGELGLESDIEDINVASKNLRHGIF